MDNFSLTTDTMKFDVVLPEDFDDVVKGIAEAFDSAEEEAENGIIPSNRSGLMIRKRLTVISDVPEAELYVEEELKAKLSRLISEAIERKCRVGGVFLLGDRRLNGLFAADFELTTVSLV
ncbi:hypothetical protein [Paraburkholderia caribensis]|uniref:hypothetical protein n=1 Tax=Paraburkholderia caribensis TaxID=75105 RepID=UPI0028651B72|nr:hypothetical protein [Paraburkholderia caribensis]MDR6379655.1 c-di-AMP phosphodiesterase-like protein [Paraburkholderia caribensis]